MHRLIGVLTSLETQLVRVVVDHRYQARSSVVTACPDGHEIVVIEYLPAGRRVEELGIARNAEVREVIGEADTIDGAIEQIEAQARPHWLVVGIRADDDFDEPD